MVVKVTPFVNRIRPYTPYYSSTFDVHMTKVKRFASKDMHMTQQLKTDVVMDFPDNLVSKIVDHTWHDGEVYMKCRWVGFTKEMDSWQRANLLTKTSPECVSA